MKDPLSFTPAHPTRRYLRIGLATTILIVAAIVATIAIVYKVRHSTAPPEVSSLGSISSEPGPEEPKSELPAGTSAPTDDRPRTSKGYLIEERDGVTYINDILIVNKTYSLPETYGNGLTAETEAAFATMRQASLQEGIDLTIVSGFRSYATQNWLYHNYASQDGYAKADRYSARPGYSEHQSGLAMDINWVDTDFATTAAGQWLHHHAWEYGFILRYPEGSEDIAGFIYEPWHFRYVGKDLAEQLYNNGSWITLEEYLGIVSQYV